MYSSIFISKKMQRYLFLLKLNGSLISTFFFFFTNIVFLTSRDLIIRKQIRKSWKPKHHIGDNIAPYENLYDYFWIECFCSEKVLWFYPSVNLWTSKYWIIILLKKGSIIETVYSLTRKNKMHLHLQMMNSYHQV